MPYIDASYYQHDRDRQALAALKAVPGFTPLLKAIMKVYDERVTFITTKSTHVEITPHQLSEYYDMVPPICEKLGIDVPTLYLSGDGEVNAYTMNENSPIIIMNTGTLQNCSKETIRAIFAHECGHIASHHVLYTTMGQLIMDGVAELLPGVGALASVGLQAAFLSWSRASEYTADRAAAIALGSAEPVEKMCVEIAGGWNDLDIDVDTELFMNQALEYEQAIQGSKLNKAFEVILHLLEGDHPLNAYRALEIRRWCATEEFENMQRYLRGEQAAVPAPVQQPMPQVAQTDPGMSSPMQQVAQPDPGMSAPMQQVAQPDPGMSAPMQQVAPDAGAIPGAGAPMGGGFCENCGTPLKVGQRFCKACGSPCA